MHSHTPITHIYNKLFPQYSYYTMQRQNSHIEHNKSLCPTEEKPPTTSPTQNKTHFLQYVDTKTTILVQPSGLAAHPNTSSSAGFEFPLLGLTPLPSSSWLLSPPQYIELCRRGARGQGEKRSAGGLSLHLNMGYYHIRLRKKASNICKTILLWIKYQHKQLTMGVRNSPGIFQEKMSRKFHWFEFIQDYINDLLNITKNHWSDYLKKL